MERESWYCVEVVEFVGHENVRAEHETTFEITTEPYLTPRGDCIIGIKASKALRDFSDCFKKLVRSSSTRIHVVIVSEDGAVDTASGWGSEELTYEDPTRIIVRRSSYVSGNTAVIRANKAARDLNRALINSLRRGSKAVAIFVAVKPQRAVDYGVRGREKKAGQQAHAGGHT